MDGLSIVLSLFLCGFIAASVYLWRKYNAALWDNHSIMKMMNIEVSTLRARSESGQKQLNTAQERELALRSEWVESDIKKEKNFDARIAAFEKNTENNIILATSRIRNQLLDSQGDVIRTQGEVNFYQSEIAKQNIDVVEYVNKLAALCRVCTSHEANIVDLEKQIIKLKPRKVKMRRKSALQQPAKQIAKLVKKIVTGKKDTTTTKKKVVKKAKKAKKSGY